MGSTLVDALELEEIGPRCFRAQNLPGTQGVVFGGQLLAQAIAAAARLSDGMTMKSMHTIFARGGDPERPLELRVEEIHRGRTFASAAVSISQGERLCTQSLLLLHHPDEDFVSYRDPSPDTPGPEQCPDTSGRDGWDVRIAGGVDVYDPDEVGPPDLNVWSRFNDVPDATWASQALLAYASDGFLIGAAMRPHPGVGMSLAHVSISTSVITQTLAFHDDFFAGDWLLLAHHSPHAGRGRSFGRADVFTQDGRLVASYEQENMIRAFTADRRPAPGERSKY
jgi:acyl-CoA thioesterase